MNCELRLEIEEYIVLKIKEHRVKWLGHVWNAINSITKSMLTYQLKDQNLVGGQKV